MWSWGWGFCWGWGTGKGGGSDLCGNGRVRRFKVYKVVNEYVMVGVLVLKKICLFLNVCSFVGCVACVCVVFNGERECGGWSLLEEDIYHVHSLRERGGFMFGRLFGSFERFFGRVRVKCYSREGGGAVLSWRELGLVEE